MSDYIIETDASLFSVVGLFGSTLQQLLAVPELALFLGTALLLILLGVFPGTVRRGKRM